MRDEIAFQDFLEDASAYLFAGDFDSYAELACLPLCVISDLETRVITTREELQTSFDLIRHSFGINHVTHLIRIPQYVHRLTDGVLLGIFETHVQSDARRVVEPFESAISLRWQDERWKAASIINPYSNLHMRQPATKPLP
ncbi:MAG: hypothetical protein ACPGNV_12865 [Mangrovicoccus sp.]